jgi:hypothetical protein
MRKISVFLFSLILFMSCSKSDDMQIVIEQMDNDIVGNNMSSGAFIMGNFVAIAHLTSGKASVNSDKTVLTFTNFKTDDGPKLLVYLSTDVNSTEYINLGDLKGVSGDFIYTIPANTDFEKFNIVNIWCVDFSVSFGTAELKK